MKNCGRGGSIGSWSLFLFNRVLGCGNNCAYGLCTIGAFAPVTLLLRPTCCCLHTCTIVICRWCMAHEERSSLTLSSLLRWHILLRFLDLVAYASPYMLSFYFSSQCISKSGSPSAYVLSQQFLFPPIPHPRFSHTLPSCHILVTILVWLGTAIRKPTSRRRSEPIHLGLRGW